MLDRFSRWLEKKRGDRHRMQADARVLIQEHMHKAYYTAPCRARIGGTKVIDGLGTGPGRIFLEMTGLPSPNPKYMRALADTWPDGELVQRLVAQLLWGNNASLGNDFRSQIAASVPRVSAEKGG